MASHSVPSPFARAMGPGDRPRSRLPEGRVSRIFLEGPWRKGLTIFSGDPGAHFLSRKRLPSPRPHALSTRMLNNLEANIQKIISDATASMAKRDRPSRSRELGCRDHGQRESEQPERIWHGCAKHRSQAPWSPTGVQIEGSSSRGSSGTGSDSWHSRSRTIRAGHDQRRACRSGDVGCGAVARFQRFRSASMTDEEKAELERLRAENEVLKARSSRAISLKVSEKGGLSVYGMGRFPNHALQGAVDQAPRYGR